MAGRVRLRRRPGGGERRRGRGLRTGVEAGRRDPLPPSAGYGQRAAVVLHHVVGYPAREIAEILGSTTPAVHVQLSRARKRLRFSNTIQRSSGSWPISTLTFTTRSRRSWTARSSWGRWV
ncbi:MAG TPA: sigma-70 region 4 domain-containing protein [Actinomycetota bacterium]|nr:sigma-70 region 4 domain-containing protein [Actinomycetota bacterium]